MTRKLHLLILPLFLLLFVSVVSAQTGTDSPASRLKQQLQEIQAQKKAAVSDIKRDAREKRMELKQEMKDTIKMKREEAKEIVKTKREELKTKLQTIKNEKDLGEKTVKDLEGAIEAFQKTQTFTKLATPK